MNSPPDEALSRDDIVGHKTLADGRHLPLRRWEADQMLAAIDAHNAQIARDMPDVKTALDVMTDAFHRLEQLGFRPAMYCPKDGSTFEVIEAGSSGIHRCHYDGEWPTGHYWIEGDDDLWPSHPILFRALSHPSPPQKEETP
jgi:hypothetical protein